MTQYNTAMLPNGLRIIHRPSASPVVYCGYAVNAGTRDELSGEEGMAHFVEHMTFKGTEKRKALQILNCLERVGGDLNAFTGKEDTVYHAAILHEHTARAVDLLTDIVFNSTYPQADIDKEVEVICDEIDSYKDSPAEFIFDEFESMMYAGQPLGRDILGSAERLRQYTTADACRFARAHYQPDNAAFYVYGDVPFNQIVRTLNKLLPAATCGESVQNSAPTVSFAPPAERVVDKGTHQAHVLVGGPAYAGTAPRRFALIILNNMLGGPGMNSRLNLALREKAGLVYSVDSYLNTYPDTGFWNVYFGCDTHDVKRCRRLLERELCRFIDKPLTAAQLAAAKKQLCGQVGISTDASEGHALALGKTFAHYGLHRDIERIVSAINAVTADEVQRVAAEVYAPDRLTTLIYL